MKCAFTTDMSYRKYHLSTCVLYNALSTGSVYDQMTIVPLPSRGIPANNDGKLEA